MNKKINSKLKKIKREVPLYYGGSELTQEGKNINISPYSIQDNSSKYSSPYAPPQYNTGDNSTTQQSLYQPTNNSTPIIGSLGNMGNSNSSQGSGFTLSQPGAYGAVGNLASGYFAGQASSAQDNADKYYNTGMAITSKAGPVGAIIGGVTAIGDKIGDPIRQRVATTNEYGDVKDNTGFQAGNVAGSLLNPAKSFSEVMTSESASKGEKILGGLTGGVSEVFFGNRRKKDVEDAAKAKIAEENRIKSEQAAEAKRIADVQAAAAEKERLRVQGINRVSNMRIDSRYLNPSNQLFAYGGNMKYPEGGKLNPEQDPYYSEFQTNLSKVEPILKDKAELYFLANKLNEKLKAKNPNQYQELVSKYGWNQEKPSSSRTRVKGADIYVNQGKFNSYLTPEEGSQVLGKQWNRYNELKEKYGKELNLYGDNEVGIPTSNLNIGARHAVAFNPVSYEYVRVPEKDNTESTETRKFKYNMNYNPNQKDNPYIGNISDYEVIERKAEGGSITSYNGYRHEDGGLTLGSPNFAEVESGETRGIPNTPTEDYIFSDRLKPIGSKITFAMKSKNIERKYNLRPWDKVSLNAKNGELDKLMQEHELVKKIEDAKNNLQEYKKGGYIKNPINKEYQNSIDKSLSFGGELPKYGLGDYLNQGWGYVKNNPELINIGIQGLNQAARSRKINQLTPNNLTYTPVSKIDESVYGNPVTPLAYIPNRNYEQIQGINSAYKGAEKAASDYSDAGSYQNRMAALAASRARNIAQATENFQNQEAQRRGQIDMYNNQLQSQNTSRLLDIATRNRTIEESNNRGALGVQQYNNAEKDALTSMQLSNYGDWNDYLTGATNTLAKKKAYNDAMRLQGAKYPNYKVYQDKFGDWQYSPK